MQQSTLIPIIILTDLGFQDIQTRLASSIIGGLIAVITGITQLEKYQEKYMLILHPKKRKTISKKGQTNTCG